MSKERIVPIYFHTDDDFGVEVDSVKGQIDLRQVSDIELVHMMGVLWKVCMDKKLIAGCYFSQSDLDQICEDNGFDEKDFKEEQSLIQNIVDQDTEYVYENIREQYDD